MWRGAAFGVELVEGEIRLGARETCSSVFSGATVESARRPSGRGAPSCSVASRGRPLRVRLRLGNVFSCDDLDRQQHYMPGRGQRQHRVRMARRGTKWFGQISSDIMIKASRLYAPLRLADHQPQLCRVQERATEPHHKWCGIWSSPHYLKTSTMACQCRQAGEPERAEPSRKDAWGGRAGRTDTRHQGL